jgi:predicted GNAT family N-acyltransferase
MRVEMPEFEAVPVTTLAQMADALAVRRRVFIEEQGVPEDEEIDDHDGDPGRTSTALHVVLYREGTPIATGRLLLPHDGEAAHIGRVAVLAEHRLMGAGRAVMLALQSLAAARGMQDITLAAQLHAIGFYERLGYAARGDVFLDAGIEHRWMDIRL